MGHLKNHPDESTTVRASGARSRVAHWLLSRWPWLGAWVLAELFVAPRLRIKPLVPPAGAECENVRVGGRLLRVHLLGSGPLVLLVHGWQGGAAQMLEIAEALARVGFRVALFDMPAHGESPGWTTSLVEFMAVLAEVAARFGRVHALVGHSLGGMAAILSAARGLEVAAVVALCPMPSLAFGLSAFSRAFGLPPAAREHLARRVHARTGLRGEDVDLIAITPRAPTLLVHDLLDRAVPVRHSRQLRDRWPNAKLIETRGWGHDRILRAPQVTLAISAFLLGLSDSA